MVLPCSCRYSASLTIFTKLYGPDCRAGLCTQSHKYFLLDSLSDLCFTSFRAPCFSLYVAGSCGIGFDVASLEVGGIHVVCSSIFRFFLDGVGSGCLIATVLTNCAFCASDVMISLTLWLLCLIPSEEWF
jgi:hypothetical protein